MYVISEMMERIQSAKDSCSQGMGRVTTDAVHRRFLGGRKTKPGFSDKDTEEDDYYYCKQCNHRMSASSGQEELKFHFENVKHKALANCVYCSKPVYDYRYRKMLEVYHKCAHD